MKKNKGGPDVSFFAIHFQNVMAAPDADGFDCQRYGGCHLCVVCCGGRSARNGQDARHQDAQRTLVFFQENRFCPTSSRLPQDYVGK